MATSEKVVSPGVFTNEVDQSFLPAAIGEIGGAGWVSKTKAGETYLSCNINEPFQKDGQAQSSSVKDDELPF